MIKFKSFSKIAQDVAQLIDQIQAFFTMKLYSARLSDALAIKSPKRLPN
jgi:hypothetical protein